MSASPPSPSRAVVLPGMDLMNLYHSVKQTRRLIIVEVFGKHFVINESSG